MLPVQQVVSDQYVVQEQHWIKSTVKETKSYLYFIIHNVWIIKLFPPKTFEHWVTSLINTTKFKITQDLSKINTTDLYFKLNIFS